MLSVSTDIHTELTSSWPELFSFLDLPEEEREAAIEATFKDIAVTAVAMNRYYPTGEWAKPAKLISTRGVQSLRLNGKGEVRAVFDRMIQMRKVLLVVRKLWREMRTVLLEVLDLTFAFQRISRIPFRRRINST